MDSPSTSAASEDDDTRSLQSSSSFGSFTSYDLADCPTACEYEEQPDFSALSKSYRWISRSFQRRAAFSRSPSVGEKEVTSEKIQKPRRKFRILSFFLRKTPSPSKLLDSISMHASYSSAAPPGSVERLVGNHSSSWLREDSSAFLDPRQSATIARSSRDQEKEKQEARLVFSKDIPIDARFDLEDLLGSPADVFSVEPGFKTTYKIIMESGKEFLVVRLKEATSMDVFGEDAEQLFRLRHSYILSLWAYYCSADEGLLVYAYRRLEGSIHSVLHSASPNRRLPVWDARFAWISQVAQVLAYLHRSCDIPHGSLNSSKILLNDRGEVLIADHGIFRLANVNFNRYKCYAPLQEPQDFTKEADVYAFGVFVFELLTGADPFAKNTELERLSDQIIRYVEWVRTEINVAEILLLSHSTAADSTQLIQELLHLGHMCTEEKPSDRPSMSEVEDFINQRLIDTESCDNGQMMLKEVRENTSPEEENSPECIAHAVSHLSNLTEKTKKKANSNPGNTLTVIEEEAPTSVAMDVEDAPKLESPEQFEIGIPPGYFPEGPPKDYQAYVMKGLADGLRDAINSCAPFDEVLKLATKFTNVLVGIGAPLEEWNSLAQSVLRAMKRVEELRSDLEQEDIESVTQLISDLRTKAEERRHAIEEDRSKLERSKQRLILAQEHQEELKLKMNELQKQMEDLRMETMSGDEAVNSITSEVKLAETGLSEQELELETWTNDITIFTQQLDHAKREKDNEISALVESSLSMISSFAGNGRISS